VTLAQLKFLHSLLDGQDHERWKQAANLILAERGMGEVRDSFDLADKVIRQFLQDLLDAEDYEGAAALLWHEKMFSLGPKFVQDVMRVMHDHHLILLQGASSTSKTFTSAVYMFLDWLRDPALTSTKILSRDEGHLRANAFGAIRTMFYNMAIPWADMDDVVDRDSDLYLGLRSAGKEFGFQGISFKQSYEATGALQGYHPRPYRKFDHPKFGRLSRIRILGDECFPGDQRVLMEDGRQLAISDIVNRRITDRVLSFNTATGKIEKRVICGWHKISSRGRKIVEICGARMTANHPVYTKELGYICADEAMKKRLTAITIYDKSHTGCGTTHQRTTVASDRRTARRRKHRNEVGQKMQCLRMLYSGGGPTRLPQVEATDNGFICPISNKGSAIHAIRRDRVPPSYPMPPEVHGDITRHISQRKGWWKKNDTTDFRMARPNGDSYLVHGRRQHVQGERMQNNHCQSGFLLHAGIGCGHDRRFSQGQRVRVQEKTRQGEKYNRLHRRRLQKSSGDGTAIHSSSPFLQTHGRKVSAKAADNSKSQCTNHGGVCHVRKNFQEVWDGNHLRPRVQPRQISNSRQSFLQDNEAVYCIDVAGNHNFFIEGTLVHNCADWPEGPFKGLASPISSISDEGHVKIVLTYNPVGVDRHVVQMAEPEQGWLLEECETLYEWVSKEGWHVLRLDAKLSENVVQRKMIYPGIQNFEGYMQKLRGEGDTSSAFYCFGRGWPPLQTQVHTVFPPSWPTTQRGEALFDELICVWGSVDCAYQGIDKVVMTVGRFGFASGWTKANGEVVKFTDPTNPKNFKSRPVLQADQQIMLEKSDNTVTLANEIIGKCKMMGIDPQWFVIDGSAAGQGTASHLTTYWGNVLVLYWGKGSTNFKVLAEDKQLANERYQGLPSELWFAAKEWMNPEVCAFLINPIISPNPLNTELSTRRAHPVKGKMCVEAKEIYKSRNAGKSPDCFVAGTLVSTPYGDTPIEQLSVGDKIITPFGPTHIIAKHIDEVDCITTATMSNGSTLSGKGKHHVFVWGKGWIKLSDLELDMIIESVHHAWIWNILSRLFTKASTISFKALVDTIKMDTAMRRRDFYTESSGLSTMGLFRAACTSITRMAIGQITESRIWNFCQHPPIRGCIIPASYQCRELEKPSKPDGKKPSNLHPYGTDLSKDWRGTKPMEYRDGSSESSLKKSASSAANGSPPNLCTCTTVVPKNALLSKTIKRLIAFLCTAKYAVRSLWLISLGRGGIAVESVVMRHVKNPVPVYNLTLAEHNVYYANGVLVENCADSLLMGVTLIRQRASVLPGMATMQDNRPKKEEEGGIIIVDSTTPQRKILDMGWDDKNAGEGLRL